MDNYNARQSMCRRNQSNCNRNSFSNNQQIPYSAPSQANDSCPYQGLDRLPLAMSYVPWQQWRNIYEPSKALWVGTIFQELDLPFCERSCLKP